MVGTAVFLLVALLPSLQCKVIRPIDVLLEENAEQRKEIKWLNDIITNKISQLNNQIDTNKRTIDQRLIRGAQCGYR